MMHYSKLCLFLFICCLFSINTYAQNNKKTWSVDVAVAPIYTNRDLYVFFANSIFKNAILYDIGVKKQFNRMKAFAFCGYFNQKEQLFLYYSSSGTAENSFIGQINAQIPRLLLATNSRATLLATNNFYFLQLQAGASYAFIKKKKWDLSIKLAYNPTIIIAQNYVVSNLQDGTISQRSANNCPKKENNSLLQFQTGLIFNYNLYKNISAFAEANFATISYEKNNFQYQLGTSLGLSYHF